jgi:phage tail-like protein
MNNPLPVFHFLVQWGGTRIGFTEVSGLSDEVAVIEYREGSSPTAAPVLIPGLKRPVSVTLKRGMLSGDNELFDWFNSIGIGTVERRDIIVSLLDESHSPTMVWKLRDAWPAQMSATDLKASANEIAIESLVLVCEGVTREAP